jgi:hypothetical protein
MPPGIEANGENRESAMARRARSAKGPPKRLRLFIEQVVLPKKERLPRLRPRTAW